MMTEQNGVEVAVGLEDLEDVSPAEARVLTMDLLWKALAVAGVLVLLYVLIYLGTWLAMLN